jgi:NAD(P)H-quinone oxidoreductase subunit 5
VSPVEIAALPLWHSALLLTPAAAAGAAGVAASRAPTVAQAWRWARAAAAVMLMASAAATAVRTVSDPGAGALWRSDTVGVAVLMLVSFVGWVVVRYSEAYLSGDPRQRSYIRGLLTTLAAVAIVVIANNLLLLTLAWMATSLALHGMLTFFGDRPVALAVAHKKFLLARCADVCMLGAVVAFGAAFGTLRIDRIAAQAAAATTLPTGARIGIALIATAALLKCAQLPFHGWLIQVMEAPTPVSALLHAGVVNIGGFVLLRVAPVVDRAVETRTLLVIVGTTTAVIAALVMTTRVSIKVALAWSTCAQMGFMLVQCGLGLWEMALLHLLAHSLYKAHAFLGAGGAVRQTQRNQLVPDRGPATIASIVTATSVAVVGTGAVALAWGRLAFTEPLSVTVWVMAGIVALALVPLVRFRGNHVRRRAGVAVTLGAIALPVVYLGMHEVFARLVPHGSATPPALLVVVGTAFALLFVVQTFCAVAPAARLPQRLYPWIYGGLFLDEAFTRLAFAVWGPPRPRPQPSPLPRPTARPLCGPPLPAATETIPYPLAHRAPQPIGPQA